MTVHDLRRLRRIAAGYYSTVETPNWMLRYIAAGWVEIDPQHTACYADRGTTWRLTPIGKELVVAMGGT